MKRELTGAWYWAAVLIGLLFVLNGISYIFNLKPFGFVMQENSYLYLLIALALLQVYLQYPIAAVAPSWTRWPDLAVGLAGLTGFGWFAWHGLAINAEGWMMLPPHQGVVWLSIAMCFVVLEALRRVSGLVLFALCTFFVAFPMFAERMPSVLIGNQFSFQDTMTMHMLDSQSLVGIPMQVTGTLLIGYIVFGVVLARCGGAKFFLDVAGLSMGRFRGGAGKIAVIASSLFGSVSGSSVSNVITTGSVTIPAMKATGFRPHVAGAIESCASTGGMLMPPVMGAVAFLMAQFLNISYFEVVVAAIVPSVLYYLGLLVVLDAYAARQGIAGMPAGDLPSGRDVMREGWAFVGAMVVLIYIIYLRMEAYAPFVAIVFVLGLLSLRAATRLTFARLLGLLAEVAGAVSELVVTLAAVGFIIGAMSMTGVGTALSGELVALAGGNLWLMLLLGACASFILGMGLTASACYIFLAVVLAPGLVQHGLNEIAVHLFILYFAIVSNITPPVALACFPAAKIAECSHFRVSFQATILGFVLYVVPFAFVLNPSLVLQSTPGDIVFHLVFAVLGVSTTGFGIGRHVPALGPVGWIPSALLVVAGVSMIIVTTPALNFAALGGAAAIIAVLAYTGWGREAAQAGLAHAGPIRN